MSIYIKINAQQQRKDILKMSTYNFLCKVLLIFSREKCPYSPKSSSPKSYLKGHQNKQKMTNKNFLDSFSTQSSSSISKDKFIEQIKNRILSGANQQNSNTLKSEKNGFVPFQSSDDSESKKTIELTDSEDFCEGIEEKKNPSNANQANPQRKRKNRRSIDQVKETYRCFCGKNFVSYPGIYVHLKDKHLHQQQNKKFFLKTFKHKTTGQIVKQVVLQNPKEISSDQHANYQQSNQQLNNQTPEKRTTPSLPVYLQIVDDDQTLITSSGRDSDQKNRKRYRKQRKEKKDSFTNNEEKRNNSEQKIQMKQYMDKCFKLTCEYKDLFEKFMKSQIQKNQTQKALNIEINYYREKLKQKDDIIKALQTQNSQLKLKLSRKQPRTDRNAISNGSQDKQQQKSLLSKQIINLEDEDTESSPERSGRQNSSITQESQNTEVETQPQFDNQFNQDSNADKETARFGCSWESVHAGSSVQGEVQPLNEEYERELFESDKISSKQLLFNKKQNEEYIEFEQGQI